MKDYLFVYGSLLPGRAPDEIAEVIRLMRPVGPATVGGRLYDLGEYSGAVLGSSARERIKGHVYELPRGGSVLKSLDEYEGYEPDDPEACPFVRRRVSATLDGGRELQCWVYVYNRDPGAAPLIPGGDYASYKAA